MSVAITIKNENITGIEKQINRECKKLDKYFLANPKVDCKILTFKKGISVKISLESGIKHFLGEAQGMQTEICINKAVKRLIRAMDVDRDILLKRNYYDSIKTLELS